MKGIFPIQKFETLRTPFYYYDLEVLRKTLRTINEEAGSHEGFVVHYAVKANANPKLLNVIREAGLGADCVSGGEVQAAIDNDAHLNDIVDELKKYGTVTVDSDMCIVCVVGDLDWSNRGFETLALHAMKNIPVRMISYGGSNYNISFLIREADKQRALQKLSEVLFR